MGSYNLSVSVTNSLGYSLRCEGLESGLMPLTTDQPARLGSCGLSLSFAAGEQYGAMNGRSPFLTDSDSFTTLEAALKRTEGKPLPQPSHARAR